MQLRTIYQHQYLQNYRIFALNRQADSPHFPACLSQVHSPEKTTKHEETNEKSISLLSTC